MSTIRYQAADLDAARRWYGELLGAEPYFVTPQYVEFRVGDYQHELGIVDSKYVADLGGGGGVVTYWHVDDIHGSFERLLGLGATVHEPPRDTGNGFIWASVTDPFGNLLGIMYNRHYLQIVASPMPS